MNFKKNVILCFILSYIMFLNAENETINWNPENKFGNNIYRMKNVDVKYQDKNPLYYTISQNIVKKDQITDLYLNFDEPLKDNIGNYKVNYKKYHLSQNKSISKNSAYFIGMDEKIELLGNENSFFQSGQNLGSFTISFWVYPANFSNNEILLRIGSQYYDKLEDTVEDQSIKAKLENSKLVWEFSNIFVHQNKKLDLVKLESFSRILPEKWTNITLVYNAYKGIITSYINNNEEGLAVVSDNGDIESTVYNLRYNPQNRCIVTIAPNFYGAVDELCIKTDSIQDDIEKYSPQGGEIISNVIDFGKGGIYINKIICSDYKENNADILYYCRYSSVPFDKDDNYSSEIKWEEFGKNTDFDKTARFFQWKAMLLTGKDNNYSPRLKGIIIDYKVNNVPSVPAGIKVLICDGSIDIKWIPNTEKDVKGYKIYYGLKSGKYFGNDSQEGSSPIDVGMVNRFKITGLDKRLLYYISVTAYDDEEHIHESDFSPEITARPSGNCKE